MKRREDLEKRISSLSDGIHQLNGISDPDVKDAVVEDAFFVDKYYATRGDYRSREDVERNLSKPHSYLMKKGNKITSFIIAGEYGDGEKHLQIYKLPSRDDGYDPKEVRKGHKPKRCRGHEEYESDVKELIKHLKGKAKEEGYNSIIYENQTHIIHTPADRDKVEEKNPYQAEISTVDGRQIKGDELRRHDRLRGKDKGVFDRTDYDNGVRSYKEGDVRFYNAVFKIELKVEK